ncbi:MAG: hypothetical protein HFH35_03605 [Eubacterium sp.]|nr:hypothetical protein [Eubacterium sp.]
MNYFSGEYFGELQAIALQYVKEHYDYVYLEAMHEKNRMHGAETIIAGSSHAMNGIVENLLGNAINFSISSQDIYCDFLHIKKAVRQGNQKIKNCIINIGYYMMYQDLSLSKNLNWMMYKIYGRLFGDMHHYKPDDGKPYDVWGNLQYDRNVFSDQLVRSLCQEWGRKVFLEQSSYYGPTRSRECNNALTMQGVDWKTLDDAQRYAFAKERTNDHNRLIQHKESRKENAELVSEMVEFLYHKKIRTIFLIMPFTRYYNQMILPVYKDDIYHMLDELEWPVELLDLNDGEGIFDDTDFLDTDHLSLKGAQKATILLADYISKWEG